MKNQLTVQTPAAPAPHELYVCADCYSWLINGDATALDILDEEESNKRFFEIVEGEHNLMQEFESLHMGCAMFNEEFCASPCDCCSSRLAGSRHHMHAWAHRLDC